MPENDEPGDKTCSYSYLLVGSFGPERADTSMVNLAFVVLTGVAAATTALFTATALSSPAVAWPKLIALFALGLSFVFYLTGALWTLFLNMRAYVNNSKHKGRAERPYISYFATVCLALQMATFVIGLAMAIWCFVFVAPDSGQT